MSLRMFTRGLFLVLICSFSLFFTAGCSQQKEQDLTEGWSAERLYRDAKDEMTAGNWTEAIKLLQKVEARFPFGTYAQQAQMDLAYAQWKDGSHSEALATIERFQRLYPNHQTTDYMLYLKGLITFYRDSPLLASLTDQDPSERDPEGARESFDSFKELVTRFPESKYSDDARLRMSYLVNAIASHEVHVARFYYRRGAYVAAANRAQTVARDFQQAPAVEEALYIMVMAYEKLDMSELKEGARKVIETNYPNSRFLKQGFDVEKDPWWKIW